VYSLALCSIGISSHHRNPMNARFCTLLLPRTITYFFFSSASMSRQRTMSLVLAGQILARCCTVPALYDINCGGGNEAGRPEAFRLTLSKGTCKFSPCNIESESPRPRPLRCPSSPSTLSRRNSKRFRFWNSFEVRAAHKDLMSSLLTTEL
jgi:hypothetical protein